MPVAGRLHRGYGSRQSSGRAQDGQNARRSVRRGSTLQRTDRDHRRDCLMSEVHLMRMKPEHEAPPDKALEVAITGMTKRFGSFTALDNVSMKVEAGSFHAL